MSLKVKLISTISAFILTLSCLLVGVFAAQNVSLTVGGNVSFTASSVYADITGSYVGTAEHPSSAQSLSKISIDADTTDGAVSMPSDWINMPLNFDESGSAITVTISIHNKAEGRTISVSLTDNTNITNVSVERKYNNSTFSTNSSTQTITGGQTGTFTFTLKVTNQNSDISGAFDLDLSLNSASQSTGSGYTATINIVDDNLKHSSEVGVAVNNSSDATRLHQLDGYEQNQIVLNNVETIAFTNYREITTRVVDSYNIILSSDAGFSGSLYSNANDFLGWYTLTQNTVFTITLE